VTIAEITIEPADVPMASPFESAQRRSTVARNARVTATLSDGTRGIGEASPAAYVTGEDQSSVCAAAAPARAALLGEDIHRWARWEARLRAALPAGPTARSAVEMALLQALARRAGLPLWKWLGGATTRVISDLSIPICPPAEAAERAAGAYADGFRHVKIKVGGSDREEDAARVRAIAERCPGVRLRLDANQGFAPAEAVSFVAALQAARVDVELLEQPVAKEDWEGLAWVTARSPVPVIADEAIQSPADAIRVAATGAAHGVNIKLAKSGIRGALEIVTICRSARLQLMIGCMLETDVGISAAVHLACATGAFDYLDLDAHLLIGLEPPYVGFRQRGELIAVKRSGSPSPANPCIIPP
jgi:L-alanine-DL-glutamate epimerase-like enolase superfamily enzyme